MAGVNGGIYSTQNVSVPSIITSAGTALAANPARLGWFIQNLGQNPLFILHGSGASTSVFTTVLAAGTSNDNGTGGTASQEAGVVYNGIITVAGTSPRFTATEWAP